MPESKNPDLCKHFHYSFVAKVRFKVKLKELCLRPAYNREGCESSGWQRPDDDAYVRGSAKIAREELLDPS